MVRRDRGGQGLAHALSSLTADVVDIADVLARLVADAAEALGAGAVAVLAIDGDDLGLLAATSHRAVEIEMLQAQQRTGPCVEALATGEVVRCVGRGALTSAWPDVGAAIVLRDAAGSVPDLRPHPHLRGRRRAPPPRPPLTPRFTTALG